jgi:hypothetical protein
MSDRPFSPRSEALASAILDSVVGEKTMDALCASLNVIFHLLTISPGRVALSRWVEMELPDILRQAAHVGAECDLGVFLVENGNPSGLHH